MSSNPTAIEVVRGRTAAVREELMAFWAERRALAPEQAEERLPEVVCVARVDDRIAGVCSVFQADLPPIGDRRFWIYRSLLDELIVAHEPAMIRATFEALDAERHGDPEGEPFGLCLLLDPASRRRLPPEAEWRDPRFVYAGYLPDGRQIRIAYFSDQVYVAAREGGWAPPTGYRVDVFAEQDQVTRGDVVEMWVRAGVLTREEAERRAHEAIVIATNPESRPIGVSTGYLERSERLRAQLWNYRTLVMKEHRGARLSTIMFLRARDHLEERFLSGADRRGIGLLFSIEHGPWKPPNAHGLWLPADTLLIGENSRGDHVRVHYFPGALAPEPD